MAHRDTHPEPGIVDKIMADKATTWAEDVRQAAPTDAQSVLEALLAEYGVGAAVRALDNQGFLGEAMRYLLNPLYEEALRRRRTVQPSWPRASTGEDEPPLTDEEFEALADQLADEVALATRREGAPATDLPLTREEIYGDHP
jgi:hypothetical protein